MIVDEEEIFKGLVSLVVYMDMYVGWYKFRRIGFSCIYMDMYVGWYVDILLNYFLS